MEAVVEARGALLFATLVIVTPVVPLFFMDSLTGSLLRPAATSYALALFASFAVALTVTPALGLLVLRSGPRAGAGSPVLGWLQRRYEGLATRSIHSPRPVVLAGAVLVVAGVAVLPFLRHTTVPEFKETDLLVEFEAAPGTSLQSMERMTTAAGRTCGRCPVSATSAPMWAGPSCPTRWRGPTPLSCGSASNPMPTTTPPWPPFRASSTATAASSPTSSPTRTTGSQSCWTPPPIPSWCASTATTPRCSAPRPARSARRSRASTAWSAPASTCPRPSPPWRSKSTCPPPSGPASSPATSAGRQPP